MSSSRLARNVSVVAITSAALASLPAVAQATPAATSRNALNSSAVVSSVQSAHQARVQRHQVPANASQLHVLDAPVYTQSDTQAASSAPRASFFDGIFGFIKTIWTWIMKFLGLGEGPKDPIPEPGGGNRPNPGSPDPIRPRPTATADPVITPTVRPTVQPTTQPTTRPTNGPTTKPTPIITETSGPIGNPGLKPQPTTTTNPTPTAQPTSNPGGSAWLNELNRIRREKGLSPVVEDPSLSQECVKHVNYMKKYGMEGHFEVEGRPEYTAAGHKCAKESNLVSGARNELDSFRIWVGSPAHYKGMIRPNLKRVGFAYGNGYGALNVIAGLGR